MTLQHGTVHAEVDVMLKLHIQKKTKIINIAVFTTNKTGEKLIMSKCCNNCLRSINIIAAKKNYIVKKIFYINENNELDII